MLFIECACIVFFNPCLEQIPVVDDIEVEFLSPMDIKVQILFLVSDI